MARRLVIALAALALTLVLAACGEKAEPEAGTPNTLSVALDWFANPDHAGIFTAQDAGYFGDAGLKVTAKAPPASDPSLPIKQAARGDVDIAVTYQPELMLARARGQDLVAIGALANRPLTSLVSLPAAKISGPSDLRGKRVATAGIPYQDAMLTAILERAGVPSSSVHEVSVGTGLVPALVSKKADAALGPFWNIEGVQLREQKRRPIVTPVDRLGVPSYDELVLVTSRSTLDTKREQLRLFLAALERGTERAASDPAQATAALVKANHDLKPDLTRKQVDATLPVLRAQGSAGFGEMNAGRWQAFADWMADQKLVDHPLDATPAMTNDLLPDRKIGG